MFKNQPKIDIRPTKKDKKLIAIGWVLIVLNLILVFFFYFDLPYTIPIHFDFYGNADAYGNKNSIVGFAVLAAVLYYIITLVATKIKPWHYNYPVKVTKKNAPELYAMSIQMIILLNTTIAILFIIMTVDTILKAKNISLIDLSWVIPVCIIFIIIALFIYTYKMFKTPKS